LKASGNSNTQQTALRAAGFKSISFENSGIEVWQINLAVSDDSMARHVNTLSHDERERAAQHKLAVGFRQFVVARSMLRRLLAIYTGIKPTALVFSYGLHGKPKLTARHSTQFNMAHSGEHAIYAVSQHQSVGVDIECIDRHVNIERVAERFFSTSEFKSLQKIPLHLRQHAFLRLWTGKEAVVKATGKGLAQLIGKFEIVHPPNQPAQIIATQLPQLEKIQLYYPDPGTGYVAAVAALPAASEL